MDTGFHGKGDAMKRTTLTIGGIPYLLAQGQSVDSIKDAVVQAARTGADLVTVTVVGNRELDILVTPGVAITFESEDVPADHRDTGDLEAPFAWAFDDYAL
jgi:hypothetical protein